MNASLLLSRAEPMCNRDSDSLLFIFSLLVRSMPAYQHTVAARIDFRERAAILDHTVRGVLSPPYTSRALGFATQDHAQARDSNAAQGNTQDMKATLAILLRKECKGCNETRRPSRPASRIPSQSSGAIVTSQPWPVGFS